jgi:hypothetical protein
MTCDHIPGEHYDDDDFKGLCYGITGNLIYDEVSLVTRPAQSSAMIVKVDWDQAKQTDYAQEGNLLLGTSERGRKAQFQSMILQDEHSTIDLISARRSDRTNKILVSFARDDVISSVLGDMSSEDDDLPITTEQEGMRSEDRDGWTVSSSSFNTNATMATSKTLDDVEKNRQRNDSVGTGSANTVINSSLGDGATNSNMTTQKNDAASVESLQMEKAQLQIDIEGKSKEITDLKATLDKKETEITRLTDDSAKMQSDLSRDYATLVAKYRALLDKPGAKFDSEEAYNSHLDDLSKRTVDSLRDSLEDLKAEFSKWEAKQAETPKKKEDNADNLADGAKVTTPAITDSQDDTNDDSKPGELSSAQDAAEALFN